MNFFTLPPDLAGALLLGLGGAMVMVSLFDRALGRTPVLPWVGSAVLILSGLVVCVSGWQLLSLSP